MGLCSWRTGTLVGLLGLTAAPSGRAQAPPANPGAVGASKEQVEPEVHSTSSYLSPAGLLAAGQHGLFVSGDTELPGYPAVEVGWRMGIADVADVGVEFAGIDVAFLGRLHGKLRLWESPGRTGFMGLRLRAEVKRHEQDVDPDLFRPIDDFGPTVAPELSVGVRLGARRQHAVYYGTYYYLDGDFRSGFPVEHYYAPLMLGYELAHGPGLHLMLDAGAFFEIANEQTAGEWVPRLRLRVGWSG